MFGQQNKLKELFSQNGWELVEERKIDHRWYVEMWLIKSNWSPTDCFVFFTFETDSELDKPTGKLTAYRIVATLKKPVDWMADSESQFEKNEMFDDRAELFLGKHLEKKVSQFFEDLSNLRQKFCNFQS